MILGIELKHEYTHYIYFPIEFDSVDDGVRSVNEKWRRDIDDEFKACTRRCTSTLFDDNRFSYAKSRTDIKVYTMKNL